VKKNALQIKKANALSKNIQAKDIQEVGEKVW
jgi:hypothetical protein